MDEGILIPISLFAAIFGIVYLYLSTRNRERLALIEKGLDASIFKKISQNGIGFDKIILLNLALLLMGIGIGIFLALLLVTYTSLKSDTVYPAMVFFTAGLALLLGFRITGKLNK